MGRYPSPIFEMEILDEYLAVLDCDLIPVQRAYPADMYLPSPPGPEWFDEDGHPRVQSFERRSSGRMSTVVRTAPLWVLVETVS